MKLPNGERAQVDIVKLRDYSLNPEHPRGRHKARVFTASVGFKAEDAEELRRELLSAARHSEAVLADRDEFGQRYTVDFMLRGPRGQARVRSTWIVRSKEDFPRLTSCYIL